jgi:hypothetical protein
VRCTWCGRVIDSEDGYRLGEEPGERRAAFCRLEHVIPWAIRGAHWEPGEVAEPDYVTEGVDRCAHCEAPLGEVHLLLVRHRGAHRIPDGFCSVDHLAAWAKAGGRWR